MKISRQITFQINNRIIFDTNNGIILETTMLAFVLFKPFFRWKEKKGIEKGNNDDPPAVSECVSIDKYFSGCAGVFPLFFIYTGKNKETVFSYFRFENGKRKDNTFF